MGTYTYTTTYDLTGSIIDAGGNGIADVTLVLSGGYIVGDSGSSGDGSFHERVYVGGVPMPDSVTVKIKPQKAGFVFKPDSLCIKLFRIDDVKFADPVKTSRHHRHRLHGLHPLGAFPAFAHRVNGRTRAQRTAGRLLSMSWRFPGRCFSTARCTGHSRRGDRRASARTGWTGPACTASWMAAGWRCFGLESCRGPRGRCRAR